MAGNALKITQSFSGHLEPPGGVEGRDAAREIAKAHEAKPGARDAPGELLLRREAADALDKILVGLAASRDPLAEPGDEREGVALVKLGQERDGDAAEFEAEEAPAGLEHAPHLLERRADVGHVAQPERDRVGIDAAIGDGKRLGVADEPVDAGELAAVERPVAAPAHHRLIDV